MFRDQSLQKQTELHPVRGQGSPSQANVHKQLFVCDLSVPVLSQGPKGSSGILQLLCWFLPSNRESGASRITGLLYF